MAGRLSRILLALSLPIVAIVSFYWLRKRKKGVIFSHQAVYDLNVTLESDCNAVSVLLENTEALLPEMQLIEVSASNVYSNHASDSSSTGEEMQKVSEKNKFNARNVNSLNGNHDKSDITEIASLIIDENNSKYSNLSDLCVNEIAERRKGDEDNHNKLDNDMMINCTRVDVNKTELNEEHCNGSDSLEVIPISSPTGATNNCDVNYNNEEFNNKNVELVSKLSVEVDNENVRNIQNEQSTSSQDSLINDHTSGESVGCASSDSGLQMANFSDIQSEGSSDSGKGSNSEPSSSTTSEDSIIIYQFEIPQDLCGRLIGRNGHYVSLIKNESNARVIINRHPYTPCVKVCSVEGLRSEIKQALYLIRKRFPIQDFPEVTLLQINVISPMPYPVPVPQSCQLHLPEGVSCDVILWSMVNAGHIFLQQPTHPTYPSLCRLDQFMTATYSTMATPQLPNPIPGVICAATIAGGWFRAMIVDVLDDEMCEVKFVDYGGYTKLPVSSLRQIRFDFMTLPFQASECYLGNVAPIGEDGWTAEANAVFEELAQGQFLQANIVGYADDGIPFVHLHRIQGASSIFINKELVERGFASWTEDFTSL